MGNDKISEQLKIINAKKVEAFRNKDKATVFKCQLKISKLEKLWQESTREDGSTGVDGE